jgi:hypothetical protein
VDFAFHDRCDLVEALFVSDQVDVVGVIDQYRT